MPPYSNKKSSRMARWRGYFNAEQRYFNYQNWRGHKGLVSPLKSIVVLLRILLFSCEDTLLEFLPSSSVDGAAAPYLVTVQQSLPLQVRRATDRDTVLVLVYQYRKTVQNWGHDRPGSQDRKGCTFHVLRAENTTAHHACCGDDERCGSALLQLYVYHTAVVVSLALYPQHSQTTYRYSLLSREQHTLARTHARLLSLSTLCLSYTVKKKEEHGISNMISYNEKGFYKKDGSCCALFTLNSATAHMTIIQLQVVSIATTAHAHLCCTSSQTMQSKMNLYQQYNYSIEEAVVEALQHNLILDHLIADRQSYIIIFHHESDKLIFNLMIQH